MHRPLHLRAAVAALAARLLDICAAAAADEESVSRECQVAAHVRDASVCVARCGPYLRRNTARSRWASRSAAAARAQAPVQAVRSAPITKRGSAPITVRGSAPITVRGSAPITKRGSTPIVTEHGSAPITVCGSAPITVLSGTRYHSGSAGHRIPMPSLVRPPLGTHTLSLILQSLFAILNEPQALCCHTHNN